jgi:flagellar motor switch protein FliM
MEIEQSVEYMQLKQIFDELFDRVSGRIQVPPKVEKPKTEKQLENMRKKALMGLLMRAKE